MTGISSVMVKKAHWNTKPVKKYLGSPNLTYSLLSKKNTRALVMLAIKNIPPFILMDLPYSSLIFSIRLAAESIWHITKMAEMMLKTISVLYRSKSLPPESSESIGKLKVYTKYRRTIKMFEAITNIFIWFRSCKYMRCPC